MDKKIIVILLMLTSSTVLAGESFNDQLAKGHALLQNGDVDGALAQYRDLQIEDPESDVLYYSTGCAEYGRGLQEMGQKAPEDALASFQTAKESFQKVLGASEPDLRDNAAFNHANCTARIAMVAAAAQKYDETVAAFEESVQEYESFLKQHPNHEGAQKNLDHMRYLLKSMLQNPPPPEEQQNQQQQDQQQEEQEQQQQQEEQEQQKEQEQEQQQQQQQEEKEQQQQQNQQEQEEQQQQQNQPEQQEQPEDRQNLDAILQSLEEIDEREQKEARNQRTEISIRRDWW